ncbi:MAG: PspC domain-containing protein [Pseudonocardia sp.]
MTKTDLQTTLREMWETRPARPPDDRQVAGVASAIARRYDIDPVLVRVAFAALAFAGIGGLLYIAGWVALPDGEGRRAPARVLPTIGLVIATVAGIGSVIGVNLSALLAGVVAAGLLVLLHQNRAHLGVAGAAAGLPAVGAPADETATESEPAAAGAATPDSDPGQRPPAWDPLGVAPTLWDLPEPPPAPAPPAPRKPRVTAYTLAAALVVGGLTGAILLITGGGPAILLGALLTVLAGGLLIGAFLHAGRGLIPFAVITALIAWGVLAFPQDRFSVQTTDLRFAPVTAAAVQPEYRMDAGTLELDLRGIDLTTPEGAAAEPIRTSVESGAGDVQIFVPPNADVTVRGEVGIGHIAFDGRSAGGPGATLDVVDDLGADGVRSGRPIILDLSAGLGNVEVHRG